jgi:putative nucleotidyltransferase with HDIG domain
VPTDKPRDAALQTARYLLKNLEVASPETALHTKRICTLAHRLGRSMGLTPEQMIVVRLGSMLHDVGKLDVPGDILHKPSALTPPELEEMRRHARYGYTISSVRQMPDEVCRAILHHHERWDGCGYPEGLRGEDIPLASRVIAVVDSFDTIVSRRCYREARAVEIARGEVVSNAGTQFDPGVAESFIGLLEVIASSGGKLALAGVAQRQRI